MAIDFKKDKELYRLSTTPAVVDVPEMIFLMIDGKGNPNTSKEYKNAVETLYGISYTIRMSKKNGFAPNGYYDYVVPPLEGLWWLADEKEFNFANKDEFCWTSMIRQPEFVTTDLFEEAKKHFTMKKPELDMSKLCFTSFTEGLCAQVMHLGTYDSEPETITKLEYFVSENGYQNDISKRRHHHEIYLNNLNKVEPEKMKTIIRVPIRLV